MSLSLDLLKVFLLVGQSNMEGAGAIHADPDHNGGQGSLEHLVRDPETAGRFAHLVDDAGEWVVREDVRISYFEREGGLTPGYGAGEDRIGPELGFGHVVGDRFDEPVLLVKVAWGGKSLAKDFRPPSSGGEIGPRYTEMFRHVRAVLGDREHEIVGFGWHQGWNDRVDQAFNDEYEENLANFIRDVRAELGIEDLPFVIAETGMSGHAETHPRALSLMAAQAAVADYDEFRGNVAFVGTKDFYRAPEVSPSGQSYHWNSNAETYYLIGESMGEAMLALIDGAAETADRRTYLADVSARLTAEWPRNRTVTVVCHGHSVPAGYFATPVVDTFNAYPHLLHEGLKARFPHAVLNVTVTAIGGENSESGAARFARDVLARRPDVVTIDYGLNDRRIGLERARAAWCAMIEAAQAEGIPVVLLTPTADQRANLSDPGDPLSRHAAQIRALAAAYRLGLVDSFAAFQAHVEGGGALVDLMSQVNHPNRAGHDLVAAGLLSWFPE